jgi:hypothetical protein
MLYLVSTQQSARQWAGWEVTTWFVFFVWSAQRNGRTVFSVWSVPRLYNEITRITEGVPAWGLAANTYLLILQRMQNKGLRTIGNFRRCTSVCDLHTAFNLPYVYDYLTTLWRRQAEVIQNHENEHIRDIGQGEARHRKYKRLKLGGGQAYDRSSD